MFMPRLSMKVGVTADMGISTKNDDDVTDDENGNADDVRADSINMKVGVTADMGISIDNDFDVDDDDDEDGNDDDGAI